MRGHIKQRAKGSWTIWLELPRHPVTGKRCQKAVTVKGTKKQAEAKLAELVHQMETGGFVNPARVSVREFLERWLDEYAWPNLAPRTAEGYEHIVRRHLIPALGHVRLGQLHPQHLQGYYADKLASGRLDGKGGLSPRTVWHHHITVHDALQSAVKHGLVGRNAADAVDPPRFQRPEMRTLDNGGLQSFLEAARPTLYYALFYLALFTGMRRSELLALRWADVDLDLAQVSVSRSLHRLRDGSIVYRQPKTAKGRRLVALPPSAALVLREHWEKQEAIRSELGTPLGGEDLVFSQPDGRPLLPDTITHAWIKLARRSGLRGIRLHDARHTHASLMLEAGIHPKIVQERLGHASIQTTLDVYSHVAPNIQQAAAIRFDQGLAPKSLAGSPPVGAREKALSNG